MVDVVHGVVDGRPNDGFVDACTDAIVPICNKQQKMIDYSISIPNGMKSGKSPQFGPVNQIGVFSIQYSEFKNAVSTYRKIWQRMGSALNVADYFVLNDDTSSPEFNSACSIIS